MREDMDSIRGLGRSPEEGNGNPLQYSWLGNPNGQRSLAGYSPFFSSIQFSHSVVSDSLRPNQAPPSTGFSRQEYWSELPFPTSGDLPNPGIESASLTSPALEVYSLPPSNWEVSQSVSLNLCNKCVFQKNYIACYYTVKYISTFL